MRQGRYTNSQRQVPAERLAWTVEIPEEGCDFAAVLAACRPYMASRAAAMSDREWFTYVYELLRSRCFPENYVHEADEELDQAAAFFMEVANCVLTRERTSCAFDRCRDYELLTPEEEQDCGILPEYHRFVEQFYDGGIYLMMRLSRIVTPFDTHGHITGVHHVAMYMARQIAHTGIAVDLGLVSGAAAMHDIGKYGCRANEQRRVPYLHYYYTYQYCEHNDLPVIGNIASNHSVWDLELENLSIESLLLIYADFRVKSVRENGKEIVCFWSLKDSYDIILSKLDNVDDAKRRRYRKVYGKLHDFEEFLISLGCSTDLETGLQAMYEEPYAVFLQPEEITDAMIRRAVAANLAVMHDIGRGERFLSLMEQIRSEQNGYHLRTLLTLLEEYSAYLPLRQKEIICDVLFEMLSHRDADIRARAAEVLGRLIGDCEIHFAKELPEDCPDMTAGRSVEEGFREFLFRIMHPDEKVSVLQRRHSGFAMKTVLTTLMASAPEHKGTITRIYREACEVADLDMLGRFILMDGAQEIAYADCGEGERAGLSCFAVECLREDALELRVAALRFMLAWLSQGWEPETNLSALAAEIYPDIDHESYCLRYLVARIREYYGIPSERGMGIYDVSLLYLENQRTQVPWICRSVNLDVLRARQEQITDSGVRYQYASHLLHLLQYADTVVIRRQAGENLVHLVPLLDNAQRYEIALELVRTLENGAIMVSEYLPPYLGQIVLLLNDQQRPLLLQELETLATSTARHTVMAAMQTIGVFLTRVPDEICGQLAEDHRTAEGILCRGLLHYEPEVAEEAYHVLGCNVYGSEVLSLEGKRRLFSDLMRQILTTMPRSGDRIETAIPGIGDAISVYSIAAFSNGIYRFLCDWRMDHDEPAYEEESRPAAFFPGTFDPFSEGHLEITRGLLRMGYRVYLSLDEYSWSKRTQPFEIRRQILWLASAPLSNVYLFPEAVQINIANQEDLQRLETLFGTKPWIVAGSDVVQNASAYRVPDVGEDTIYYFPHAICERGGETTQEDRDAVRGLLHGEIRYLQLSSFHDTVSSSRIREAVILDRDITGLVDPVVRNYIMSRRLYAIRSVYKTVAMSLPIDVEERQEAGSLLLDMLGEMPCSGISHRSDERLAGEHALVLWLTENGGHRICGAGLWHDLDPDGFYDACGSVAEAGSLRQIVSGRIAVLTAIYGEQGALDDKQLTVINELLVSLQSKGYSYALCRSRDVPEAFVLHGAVHVAGTADWYVVNLTHPLVVFYDTPAAFHEPFSEDPEVVGAVRNAHFGVLRALTGMFPGELLLTFDAKLLNYRLIRLITESNGVGVEPTQPRVLGPKMCVPFGKILRGTVIPNTVTRQFDTERVFKSDLSGFSICEKPGYAPLDVQAAAIRAFGRPMVLVDDLYHYGFRQRVLQRHMERAGIGLSEIVVGVISGHGRDIARERGVSVQAAYTVMNMRACLVESEMLPLVGGDSIESEATSQTTALVSVNRILPYADVSKELRCDRDEFYHLSEVCLSGAAAIYSALERRYRMMYSRNLTLERLDEVMVQPRILESCAGGDMTRTPSEVLGHELERLRRLQG